MLVFEEEKILFVDSTFNSEAAFQERLFVAVMIGNEESLNRSLKQAALLGWSVDIVDHEGYTPLMRAALDGNIAFVKKLLESGANPFLVSKIKGTSYNALLLATKEGYPEILRLLLSKRQEGKEQYAFQAAKMAISYGKNEALEVLLNYLKEEQLEELFHSLNEALLQSK